MEKEVSSSLHAKRDIVSSLMSFHLPHRSPSPCYPKSLWSLNSSLGLCGCLIPAEPVMAGKKCSPWALRETKVPTWPLSMNPLFLVILSSVQVEHSNISAPHSMVPETYQSCWFWTHPQLWGTPWVFLLQPSQVDSEWSSWRGRLPSLHLLICLFHPGVWLPPCCCLNPGEWRNLWVILQDTGKIMGG